MSAWNPVLLLPHFNHIQQFLRLLPQLEATGYPLLVVDDGSEAKQQAELRSLADQGRLQVHCLATNRGKGAAVMRGFDLAAQAGYSHALQVDADGQHNPADIKRLLEHSRNQPQTLICGEPVFGDDMPPARRWGRKITDFFVVLETWSFSLKDSMCGLRVYPLASTLPMLAERQAGQRMDFDTEILVHAYWRGLPIEFVQTPVRYPEDGLSHFNYWSDNWRITAMHSRLLLGMLPRIPTLLARHFRNSGQPS